MSTYLVIEHLRLETVVVEGLRAAFPSDHLVGRSLEACYVAYRVAYPCQDPLAACLVAYQGAYPCQGPLAAFPCLDQVACRSLVVGNMEAYQAHHMVAEHP